MKPFTRVLVVASAAALVAAAILPAYAGRIGGPLTTAGVVPGALSVYYEIPFAGNQQAVVSIAGDGSSILHVLVYDGDGHVIIGEGSGWDRKTATIDVHRAGVFRVEVRNLGIRPNAFSLTTN